MNTKNIIVKKTICHVAYVIGIYLPNITQYAYWTGNKWHSDLNLAEAYRSAKEASDSIVTFKVLKYPNNALYSITGKKILISKVFIKNTVGEYRNRTAIVHREIHLTKPNHYENLCAVVNHI